MIQRLGCNALHILYSPGVRHPVFLSRAHFLEASGNRVGIFIIDLCANGIREISLFTFDIIGYKAAVFCYGLEKRFLKYLQQFTECIRPSGIQSAFKTLAENVMT